MKRTLQEIADMFEIYVVKNSFPNKMNQYKFFLEKPHKNIEGGFWESTQENGYPWYGSTFDTELIEPFTGDWKDSLHVPQVTCPECDGKKGYYISNNSKQVWKRCTSCKQTGKIDRV